MPAETGEMPDLSPYLGSNWLVDPQYLSSKSNHPVAIVEGGKLPTPPEQNSQPTWSELPSAPPVPYLQHWLHSRHSGRIVKQPSKNRVHGSQRGHEYYAEPTSWYQPQAGAYDWVNMHLHHDGYGGLAGYPGQVSFHHDSRPETVSAQKSRSKPIDINETSPTIVSSDEDVLTSISPSTSLASDSCGAPSEVQLFLAVRDGRTSRAYTFEENEIIMRLKKGGVQWKDTAAIVPRTDKSLQVHFSQHLKETAQARELEADVWDNELDNLLVQLVMKDSEVFWTNIEKQFRMKAADILPKVAQAAERSKTASDDVEPAGNKIFNALNLRWRYLNLLEPCRMRVEEILKEISRARKSPRSHARS